MTTAIMQRKRMRQTPKRSCGLRPTAAAKDSMPAVVPLGTMYSVFGWLESTKIAEELLLNWSAKSDGGS